MGQQQLLLLVLGTVIVGVAIVVGINVFNSGAVQANQDAVVQDCLTIAGKAINWAKTPAVMGGGLNPGAGPSFNGFDFQKISFKNVAPFDEYSNANGSYSIAITGGTQLDITGYGIEGSAQSPFEVVTTVDLSQPAGQEISTVVNTNP